MKNRPIHENLDTSFVNLSALIKYLRRRQFVGKVKVQLNGYKADINLQEDNQMKVKEHDQISGRISEGEEALQRLLIRAREPGGTINVYQFVEEIVGQSVENSVEKKSTKINENTPTRLKPEPKVEITAKEVISQPVQSPVQKNAGISLEIPEIASAEQFSKSKNSKPIEVKTIQPVKQNRSKNQDVSLPNFPFRLSNKVEEKAKLKRITDEEWHTLLRLTVELLTVVDKSLAQANLDFAKAFRKACTEIGDDYPFLKPESEIFGYKKGKIKMTKRVNSKIFISSITEALRRILEKLESNPKFAEVHRSTVQTLIATLNKRKNIYDKFAITPQLKKILGI